jgi:hypothetical protein
MRRSPNATAPGSGEAANRGSSRFDATTAEVARG